MFNHRYSNKGVSVVEYALLAALIGTASVLAVTTFGTQTAALFEREDLRLADSNGGGDNGSGGSTGSGDGLGDHRATQNLDMSLFRIVNVNDPLNPSDAATKSYVDASVASISADGDDLGNHTATQNLDLATNRIVNLGSPQDGSDAATKSYVDAMVSGIPGGDGLGDHTASQNLDLATNRIVNLGAPQDDADATTKAYVDAAIAGIPGGDNLGDHTATQNIALNGNWLSGDGDDEGIFIADSGNVAIGGVTQSDFRLFAYQNASGADQSAFAIRQDGSSDIARFLGPNATERVRITSAGKLGIRTENVALGSNLQLGRVFSFAQDINSGYIGAGWHGANSSSATYAVSGNHAVRTHYDSAQGAIIFSTAPVGTAGSAVSFGERMRITAAGRIGINNASPSSTLDVVGSDSNTRFLAGGESITVQGHQANNIYSFDDCANNPHFRCGNIHLREIAFVGTGTSDARWSPRIMFHWGNRAANSLFMDAGGHFNFASASGAYGSTVRAASFQTMSDRRLKTAFRDIDGALDKIARLRGQEFSLTSEEGERRHIGLIAQEVAEVFPQAVSENTDGMLSVDYAVLVAPLIEAVKEIKEENAQLRKENENMRREMQSILNLVSNRGKQFTLE